MLENQPVILITGAKGGLGSFVTQAFLESGAKVVGSSRSIQTSDFDHPDFHAIPAELSSTDAARQLVEAAITHGGQINAAVHLVGAFAGGTSLIDTTDELMLQMLETNFWSAFHLFRAVLPHMRERGSGGLFAVGSRTALEPQPSVGAYSVSKAALVSLITTLARENKDRNITANLVLPGTMDTPANRKAMPGADPLKWISPASVAQLIVSTVALSGLSGATIPMYGQEL